MKKVKDLTTISGGSYSPSITDTGYYIVSVGTTCIKSVCQSIWWLGAKTYSWIEHNLQPAPEK